MVFPHVSSEIRVILVGISAVLTLVGLIVGVGVEMSFKGLFVNKAPGTHRTLISLLVISHVLLTNVELEVLVLLEGLVTEGAGEGPLSLVLVGHVVPEREYVRQLLAADGAYNLRKEPIVLLDMPQVSGSASKLLPALVTQKLLDRLFLHRLATGADAAEVHFNPNHLLVDDQHVFPVLPMPEDDLETAFYLTLNVLSLVTLLMLLEPLIGHESLPAHVAEEIAANTSLLFPLYFLSVWITFTHPHVPVALGCVPEPLVTKITMFRGHSLFISRLSVSSPLSLLLLFT